MDLRHIGSVALLAMMAVAALSLFPIAHGPFSATHGPITAVRDLRLRAILLSAIASAAAALVSALMALVSVGRCAAQFSDVEQWSADRASSPLRC